MSGASDRRVSQLTKLFYSVIEGKKNIISSHEAGLFLESMRIRPSPTACVEMIISSGAGLEGMRKAITVDLSAKFIKDSVLPFIKFISNSSVKALAGGQLLRQVLIKIVEPPTFWSALLGLVKQHALDDDGLHPFAWLALELICLPQSIELDFSSDVKEILKDASLDTSGLVDVRNLHVKIQHTLRLRTVPGWDSSSYSPGGRHDNDFADFRNVQILPTGDEFLSTEKPYYRTAKEVADMDVDQRLPAHLDNQFRLLREDMLQELKDNFQVATGRKRGGQRAQVLGDLRPARLRSAEGARRGRQKRFLTVTCGSGLQGLPHDKKKREKFLKDSPWFLKHESFGALCEGDSIVSFAFVERDERDLLRDPPEFGLRFADEKSIKRALMILKFPDSVRFILMDTPVFAYRPVLDGLQSLTEVPLASQLMAPDEPSQDDVQPEAFRNDMSKLQEKLAANKRVVSSAAKGICLDESQIRSIINFLESPVSLTQGPPGTGKSFVGAQMVKMIMERTSYRVLLITYTHHALDDALGHLIDVGVAKRDIVRIGSKAKATDRTQELALSNQSTSFRRSQNAWKVIYKTTADLDDLLPETDNRFRDFKQAGISLTDLKELWEFSEDDTAFCNVFDVPQERDGFKRVGKKGRQVEHDYLFTRWLTGNNPGIFTPNVLQDPWARKIWELPPKERQKLVFKWREQLVEGRASDLADAMSRYNAGCNELDRLFDDKDIDILENKRITACTTTAAAKYRHLIKAYNPDVVVVEEAGEILEAHVLAALAPNVKRLILIGDHKQLRPRVNNYGLTVEKGDGYDLNRSLFERLILQGMRHVTLSRQHRAHPNLSVIIRTLTYPELQDGPKTPLLGHIRALRDRVVFLNHSKLEDDEPQLRDRRDPTLKTSKKNTHEAHMVLRCVRFLVQQGYGTENIVVLTPYVGQLFVLRGLLSKEHDPWLDDMDSYELVRAGLMPQAAANVGKRKLRLSTIDNYQGEECDIVIISLTRSNDTGDIGFLAGPERVNVLLSRARKGLVMVGNMMTFMASRKGRTVWTKLFELLKEENHIYDGLPVRCEQHPEKTALLEEPGDFERYVPDGGCDEPCGMLSSCNVHHCPRRCHRLADHSKAACHVRLEKTCSRGHKRNVECGRQNETCRKCVQEDEEMERRVKRDLQLEADRMKRQQAYKQELQEINDELEHEQKKLRYQEEQDQQKKDIEAGRERLAAMKATAARSAAVEKSKGSPAAANASPDSLNDLPSDAREEWQDLKESQGARNPALDELMDMIGLEEVKAEFLNIKSRVDTAVRQRICLNKERFSASLVGNPGTGKTTVARLYAKFLTSVGVLPGACFEETTGAALAHAGVSGCKKTIEKILNDGGGILFIDEAYQLASGQNPGGGAVLDYLLPEVENLTGKLVFVLAGYKKQMEGFFAHNPGLPSRFPVEMEFADYTDDQLLRIMELKIHRKYQGRMKAADGPRGLYFRIASRRIGKARGKEGFGNARAVENAVARIGARQAIRLRKARKTGQQPDDLFFTMEDIIGPEPGEALKDSAAWKKLQGLIGLGSVKQSVGALVDSLQQNYVRELREEPPIEYSLNKVFLGNPGTGKTTVAKLYGSILADLGLLSKGEVVVKVPADFVGSVLGQSEQNTKGILASTVGKVLVIDEAYGLYGGGDNQGTSSDPYKTAVVDTIVAEVQSVPGDDRCVLLLGYKEQLEKMFQNVNPGLSRRFPMASAFIFEDFDDQDLGKILGLKLKQQAFRATGHAQRVAMEMLGRARNRPNFGNGGEVDILLDRAKANCQKRWSAGESQSASILEAIDFDPDHDRAERAETNVDQLFAGTVASGHIITKLKAYQQTARTMNDMGLDPKEVIPFSFLFRGPPGTGKTTTARKMGKVFYDMGFLASAEVVESSATDLVGQYVGQTGPKVQQVLDKALGKVLFVDEAYRLAEGHFAKEAMDELVDSITKERYHCKMIIILAGYDSEINQLMSINPGLTSRFPETIDFHGMSPEECILLLTNRMQGYRDLLKSKPKSRELDVSVLEDASSKFQQDLKHELQELGRLPSWANARDIVTLAKSIWNKTIATPDHLVVTQETVLNAVKAMRKERQHRASATRLPVFSQPTGLVQTKDAENSAPSRQTTTTATAASTNADADSEEDKGELATDCPAQIQATEVATSPEAQRDPGVTDEVWSELQADKRAEQEQEAAYQRLLEARAKARDEEREKIVKMLLEEEESRKQEAEIKRKLQMTGRCCAGFAWIKQAGGYRCAGGSHWMGDDEVSRLLGA